MPHTARHRPDSKWESTNARAILIYTGLYKVLEMSLFSSKLVYPVVRHIVPLWW